MISGEDLTGLGAEHRQYLFDAVAAGSRLVVCAPLRPVGDQLDALLARRVAVTWSDGKGHELREASYLGGYVRATTLTLEEVVQAENPLKTQLLGRERARRRVTPGALLSGAVSRRKPMA